jgi:fimbrial chaperone protein
MKVAFLMVAALFVHLAGERVGDAYNLEPISRVFAPAGSGSTQSFQLTNSGTERVALTVSFTTLELDADHAETNRGADDDFLVYPPQILLAPNSKQTVRVTWLGSPTPASELVYRIVVQQVPVELLDKTAPATPTGKLKVLVTYRGSLYIRPAAAAPNVVLQSATLAKVNERTSLVVTLRNAGTAVGLVKGCNVLVRTPTGTIEVPSASVSGIANTRVLARHTRRYTLPWSTTLEPGAVSIAGKCNFTTP